MLAPDSSRRSIQAQRVVDGRERVAKLVREHGQETVTLLDLVAQRHLDLLETRDIDERHDHASSTAAAAVGQHPHEVGESEVTDGALEALSARAHAGEQIDEARHVEVVDEPVDAAADVGRDEVEDLGHRGRELADREILIEEQRVDLRAQQEVVHVVGQLGQLVDLLLELGVDGVQLLVDRVQLLVDRVQLLVAGEQFFVGRLQLLVADLELFDRRMQVLLGLTQLRLERVEVVARRLIEIHQHVGLRTGERPGGRRERDQIEQRVDAGQLDRPYADVELAVLVERAAADVGERDRRAGARGPMQRASDRELEVALQQIEQAQRWPASRQSQQRTNVSEGVDDLMFAIRPGPKAASTSSSSSPNRSRRWVSRLGGREALVPSRPLPDGVARQRQQPRVTTLAIDPPLLVERIELVDEIVGRLARAQEQHAVCVQAKVKQRQRLALRPGLQVDEQVAAADEVELGERCVSQHVVLGKHDHAPQLTRYAIAIVLRHEEASDSILAERPDRGGRVQTDPGKVERGSMRIGSEDLRVERLLGAIHRLEQQDAERVGLFAGRTAGHPQAQLGPVRGLGDELRDDLALEQRKRLGVAEERGHADQQVAIERLELGVIALQTSDVVADVIGRLELNASLDSPRDGARLVGGEVDAVLRLQQREHGLHAAELGRVARW